LALAAAVILFIALRCTKHSIIGPVFAEEMDVAERRSSDGAGVSMFRDKIASN
jgi:hypothetical protein